MLEVRPTRDDVEEEVSLDIYNRVWPWDAVTMDDVRSFRERALEYGDGFAERGLEEFDAVAPEDDPESLGWAARRGFREVERNFRLVLDLTEFAPAPVDPPPGVEITTWAERPELARAIYDVACEAYPDVPGDRDRLMEPFEDWLRHDLARADKPAEATFVALAGDEVIGYAKLFMSAARPREASHDMTGVKRS